MRINHNVSAMKSHGMVFLAQRALSKSLERLSTGLRINRSADDAAGLGVSENLRSQVRGLGQALKNTQDAISMLTIADGALEQQADILQRMREIVIQAKNDTYTDRERTYMYQEFRGLMEELDRIGRVTNYNGMMLFAAPEAVGNNIQGVYNGGSVNGFDTGEYKTNHHVNDAREVWTDDNNSIFGAEDESSAHHFNMMIGANFGDEDVAAFDAVSASYGDRGAANMITIQFGQMDANAILTPGPITVAGMWRMWDASTMWGSFEWDTGTGIMNHNDRDWFLDYYNGPNVPENGANIGDMTLNAKLNFLQQLIDGDPTKLSPDYDNSSMKAFYRGNTAITGLERVNRMRGAIGSWINRLEHAANNTANQISYQQAAESLIRDADIAEESTIYTRNAIITQSSTAMLAQANISQQSVLQLLR